MTRPVPSRRGSALLVVLGMLAFMVISGMAFSTFMRYQRLPSSVLRRSVTTRQLSKAALAEAIDEVDRAIGDDPYPNRRTVTGQTGSNKWIGRVYVGNWLVTDDAGNEQSAYDILVGLQGTARDDYKNLAVHGGNSVATFPFEGLAYIPPALVNDVRFYSRRTPTAQWSGFAFDSGRYAFTCVDVSDCFDVNRMFADLPRASAAARRITLGYAFEQGADHAAAGTKTKSWDDWLLDFRDVKGTDALDYSGSKVPLVSVADFNLAFYDEFGTAGCDGLYSPFANYVQDAAWTKLGLLGCDGNDAEKMEKRRNEMFVTDGLYPLTASERKILQLDLAGRQPFQAALMKDSSSQGLPSLLNFGPVDSACKTVLKKYFCGMNMAALFDYLDEDSVPVSLAIPTTERVPMVCGVQPKLDGLRVAVVRRRNAGADGKDGKDVEVSREQQGKGFKVRLRRIDEYRVDADAIAQAVQAARVNPVLAFPFLPDGSAEAADDAAETWTLDGRLALFFSTDATRGGASGQNVHVGTRVGEGETYLHPDSDAAYAKGGLLQDAVIAIPLKQKTFSFKDLKNKPTTAAPYANYVVDSDAVSFNFGSAEAKVVVDALGGNGGDAATLLAVTYEWETQEDENGTRTKTEPTDDDLVSARNALRPIDCEGAVSDALANTTKGLKGAALATAIAKLRNLALKAAVWVRVKNADGDTVDLVPACTTDDVALNGAPAGQAKDQDCRRCCGFGFPLLKFNCGDPFAFTIAGLEGLKGNGLAATPSPKAALTADPRYNHAPEDWFQFNGGSDPLAKADWYGNCGCSMADRDGDIFMATSDRGYLQSAYEFAFLPRLTEISDTAQPGNSLWGDLGDEQKNDGKSGRFANNEWELDLPANIGAIRHSARVWRTYRPYDQGGQPADDFDALGIIAGRAGCRANPYSDVTNVLAAAFANTPFNWRVASTNDTVTPKPDYLSAKTASAFNRKYAWNAYVDLDWRRFAWQDVTDFAGGMMSAMDGLANGETWRDAFANQDWHLTASADGFSSLLGVDLDQQTLVTSVDRRFLYGFWHDSFATRQQLFLFFVRAEPMMMGGGVSGAAPPQLSSRAVALVWRDPEPPSSSSGTSTGTQSSYKPHRTRLLFYHQFE